MRKKVVHKKNDKLRRARELRGWSQVYVSQQIGTAENQLSRWESGKTEPSKFYQEKLCALFDMNAAELGFISEPKPQKATAPITEEAIKSAVLQAIIEAFEMLGGLDLNNQRRALLQATLGLIGTPLAAYTGPRAVEPLDAEESLHRWQSTVETFWHLYFSGGIPVIEQCLPGLLIELSQAAQTNQNAAALAVQAYQIEWLLSLQRQDFGMSLKSIGKAQVCADLVNDPDLKLSSIIREAHTYFHLKNPVKQLIVHKRGLQIADASSPLVKSWLYLLVGENYARLGDESSAHIYLDLSKNTLPGKPEEYPAHSYVRMNQYLVSNFEVILHLNLSQPHKALNIINHLDLSDGDPRQSELLNHRLFAWYELRDMPQMCKQFPTAVQFANKSKSGLRVNEIHNVYAKMITTWPNEKRVRQLQEVLHD